MEAHKCVGSICQKYDLEECFLTAKKGAKPDEMCEVACQSPDRIDTCRRTSEIEAMRNISGLKLRPGSPCNDFQGYCDVFQRCRAVDAEGPFSANAGQPESNANTSSGTAATCIAFGSASAVHWTATNSSSTVGRSVTRLW